MQATKERAQKLFLILLTLALVLTSQVSDAKIRFGPEFNFTSDAIIRAGAGAGGINVNNFESEKIVAELRAFYKETCAKKCKVKTYRNKYGVKSVRVIFDRSWYFEVETDPGVVEVKMSALKVDDIADRSQIMQAFIFKPIYDLGLKRANDFFPDWAGGHIHIDVKSAFGKDLSLFRNFIVDYTNHVELAHKIFNNDRHFAPSIQILDAAQRAAFERLIQETDAGQVESIREFAKRLQNEVYYKNPFGHQADKHQALNVTRIASDNIEKDQITLELRAFQSQESPEIFRLEAQLIESRIDFLKRWKSPIGIRWLQPDQLNDELAVFDFYRYVRDSKLNFAPYKVWIARFAPDYLQKAVDSYRPSLNDTSCSSFFFQ